MQGSRSWTTADLQCFLSSSVSEAYILLRLETGTEFQACKFIQEKTLENQTPSFPSIMYARIHLHLKFKNKRNECCFLMNLNILSTNWCFPLKTENKITSAFSCRTTQVWVSGGTAPLRAVISNKRCNFDQMQHRNHGNYTLHCLLRSKSNSHTQALLKKTTEERVTLISSVKNLGFITPGNKYWVQMSTSAAFFWGLCPLRPTYNTKNPRRNRRAESSWIFPSIPFNTQQVLNPYSDIVSAPKTNIYKFLSDDGGRQIKRKTSD